MVLSRRVRCWLCVPNLFNASGVRQTSTFSSGDVCVFWYWRKYWMTPDIYFMRSSPDTLKVWISEPQAFDRVHPDWGGMKHTAAFQIAVFAWLEGEGVKVNRQKRSSLRENLPRVELAINERETRSCLCILKWKERGGGGRKNGTHEGKCGRATDSNKLHIGFADFGPENCITRVFFSC